MMIWRRSMKHNRWLPIFILGLILLFSQNLFTQDEGITNPDQDLLEMSEPSIDENYEDAIETRDFGEGPVGDPMEEEATEGSQAQELQQIVAETEEDSLWDGLDFDFELRNYVSWRNDTDFSRAEPAYNPDGQSQGFVLTCPYLYLGWEITDNVQLYYAMELPYYIWGRNYVGPIEDVSQYLPAIVHKELWGEVSFMNGIIGTKAGLQHFYDPTKLILEDWTGVATVFTSFSGIRINLSAGLLTDENYEGIILGKNNFMHDNVIFMLDAKIPTLGIVELTPALVVNLDRSINYNAKYFYYLSIHADFHLDEGMLLYADAVFQTGKWDNGAPDNTNIYSIGWAAQVGGELEFGSLGLYFNLLGISADDNQKGNKWDYSFNYSGRSRSRTLYLSENELIDRFDNIDEVVAESKAGLFLVDITLDYKVSEWFIPFFTGSAALSLQKEFTYDDNFIASELDLGMHFVYEKYFLLTLIGGVLIPHTAGSSLLNSVGTSLEDNDLMGFVEARMSFFYR